MKISQKPFQNGAQPKQAIAQGTTGFAGRLESAALVLRDDSLEKALQAISDQGERIARFRSLQDVLIFKQMVQTFLQDTVKKGFQLNQDFSFATGSSSVAIQQMDDKLIELTDAMLDQEKPTVAILGLIGEIKGLLVNVYT